MARNQKQIESFIDSDARDIVNETEEESESEEEQPVQVPTTIPKRRRGAVGNLTIPDMFASTSQAVASKGKGRKRKPPQSIDPEFELCFEAPNEDSDRIMNKIKIGNLFSGNFLKLSFIY